MIRWIAVVAVGCLLAACTSGEDRPDDSRGASEPSQPTTSADTSSEPASVPVVLAVQPTRVASNVPTDDARQLVAEGAHRWATIGQGGGRMRVVAAPGLADAENIRTAGSARAALRAVRNDESVLALLRADTVDASVRVLPVGGTHPLRSPRSYPLQSDGGAAPESVTTITAVGDIMLGRRVGERIDSAGDSAAPLRPLARRLGSADITVGNLESTLSQAGAPRQGDDSFGADPSVTQGLNLAGFDVLSLANNHLGDYGAAALRQTLKRITTAGIEPVGAGTDRSAARTPVIVQADGTRVGFYATDSIGETPAASSRTPGTNRLDMPPRTGPLDRDALRQITSDIRRLDRRADTVVVIPHWGTQYTHDPEPIQRRVARAFVHAGADVVVGGHPHWVQDMERVDGATVAHSLGNFVFDMDFMRQTQEGVFLEIVLWDGRVVAADPVPYVIGRDFAPRVAHGARARAILSAL